MLLPQFDFLQPTNIGETCEILDQYGEDARLLAGGTDLLVSMKRKLVSPSQIVALDMVSGLDEVELKKGQIEIGPLVTASQIAEHRSINRLIPILNQAAGGLGSPPIRNRATIGGNLVTARPAADLIPPLLVLDARLDLENSEGERELPIARFLVGPGETKLKPNEVLTRVVIPRPARPSGGAYIKFGARHSCEISIVSVAAFVEMTPAGRRIKEARLALGAVAPKAIRCPRAEALLAGTAPGDETFAAAGKAAARTAKPISDHRGSARYRRQMVEVLARRALASACKAARSAIRGGKR